MCVFRAYLFSAKCRSFLGELNECFLSLLMQCEQQILSGRSIFKVFRDIYTSA